MAGGENGLPFMPDSMDNVCAKCGSCEAFCPEKAISPLFDTKYSIVSESVSGSIDPEHLGLYMRTRRSVRNYKESVADKKTIEDLLDIVRYAPSGVNIQPVKWLIVHSPAEVSKISSLTIDWMREVLSSGADHPMKPMMPALITAHDSGLDPICRGAPHLAIVYSVSDMSYTDCIIAMTWFELAAPSFNLGACWAGFLKVAATTYQPLIDELNLPDENVVQHAMMFGYPEYEVHSIPGRNLSNIIWK
ncbi:MAG: nitroreductase family protein [Methanolobus sp.]